MEIKARTTELVAGLKEARTEIKATAQETETSSSKMGGAMTKATGYSKALAVGVAGVAGVIVGFSVEAAMAGQKVDAQLSTAIKNAGGNMEEFDPKIKAVDSRLRQFGFTNDQTNAALTRLTVATKDPAKALSAVGVAADLARSRNIPLATATDLVAKAMAGQTGALTRMGISLPIAAGGAQKMVSAQAALTKAQDGVNAVLAKYPDAASAASKGHAAYEKATAKVTAAQKTLQTVQSAGGDVLKALSARVHGAASAYGDTLAGKVASAKANLENMGEVIGSKLIPVISDLLSVALKVGEFLGKHKELLIVLGGVIAALVVPAFISWAVAAGTAAVATIAAAAPILAIIAAVTALGVGIYELVTHWTTVWNAIKGAVSTVWDFLKGVWDWISNTFFDGIKAGVTLLGSVWNTVWGGIKSVVQTVWDNTIGKVWGWIKDGISTIKGFLSDLGGVFHRVWDDVSGVLSKAWNGTVGVVFRAIKGAINDITGAINTVIGAVQTVIGWFSRLFSSANNANSAASRAAASGAAAARTSQINMGSGTILGALSTAPRYATGGWITAPFGVPQVGVNHGGEYMLSNDMLANRQRIDPKVVAAVGAQASMSQQALTGGSASSGGGTVINAYVSTQTNADPHRIAADIGWELRGMR